MESDPFNFFYNSFKYFIIFIDNFSKATCLYLLKTKEEVFNYFLKFIKRIETQYNEKIRKFRFDNGTKFINNKFILFFKEKRNHTSNVMSIDT
jgi:hypothetical protein